MVRFRRKLFPTKSNSECAIWDIRVGILLEYHTWEKIATVLCEGEIYRIHGSDVQKAGKKDSKSVKMKDIS
jgi:hypothetical protein